MYPVSRIRLSASRILAGSGGGGASCADMGRHTTIARTNNAIRGQLYVLRPHARPVLHPPSRPCSARPSTVLSAAPQKACLALGTDGGAGGAQGGRKGGALGLFDREVSDLGDDLLSGRREAPVDELLRVSLRCRARVEIE